jgi:hypothetical protein
MTETLTQHVPSPFIVTAAKSQEQYMELMNRLLAQEKTLPDLKKQKSLAASKPKAIQLRNQIVLTERDVEYGKWLQDRIAAIESKYEVC